MSLMKIYDVAYTRNNKIKWLQLAVFKETTYFISFCRTRYAHWRLKDEGNRSRSSEMVKSRCSQWTGAGVSGRGPVATY